MFALLLYGYSRSIYSEQRLARACGRAVAG
ncbi:MAG: hypothetical protein IOC82_03840 [Aestuariivirga sp.]|nr:hypothetical protein [Aestuariivirga sp.]